MRKKVLLLVTAVPTLLMFFSFAYLVYGYSSAATCSVPASYATVQAAIDDANCDTISVDTGTYTEYVTINRDVVIEGTGVNTTVFDGLDAGRPFTILDTTAAVTLRNLGIQNGNATTGGGILNHSALTLDNVWLTGNDSPDDGGGIYSTNDLSIESVFFIGNSASNGGAIYLLGSPVGYLQLDISNSNFMSNNASVNGGALNISYATTNITDTFIDSGTALSGGGISEFCGGVTMIGGSGSGHTISVNGGFYSGGCGLSTDVATFRNVNIIQNNGALNGGAIYRTGGLEIYNSSLSDNSASNNGGAIYSNKAEIYDTYIGFNDADRGAGVYIAGGIGEAILDTNRIVANTAGSEFQGAIYAGTGVSMTVSHSEINLNPATGIYNAGTLTVIDTQIMTNTRGIYHASATLPVIVSRSTIADNIVALPTNEQNGAGIRSFGPLTVRFSTINDNRALKEGGGITSNGPLTLTNMTISGNHADNSGGGIWHNNDDPATLKGVTIYDNVAGDTVLDGGNGGGLFIFDDVSPETVTVNNSIIAENRDYRNPDGTHPDCSGRIDSATRNLLGIDTGCTLVAGGGNIIGTSGAPETADLNPLADNGGATFTHEPQNSSPALNSGNCASINADQRGVERVNGIGCDMGAYEDGICPTPIVPDVDISLLYSNAELSWTRDQSVQRLFKIYYSNIPYPGGPPELIKNTTGDHYSRNGVTGGNVAIHDFFFVRSSNACGELSGKDAVGVFEFVIEPGV